MKHASLSRQTVVLPPLCFCTIFNQDLNVFCTKTCLVPLARFLCLCETNNFPNISSMNMFSWSAWYCFLCIECLIPLTTEIKHIVDYWRDVLIHYWQLGKKLLLNLDKKSLQIQAKSYDFFLNHGNLSDIKYWLLEKGVLCMDWDWCIASRFLNSWMYRKVHHKMYTWMHYLDKSADLFCYKMVIKYLLISTKMPIKLIQ